MSLQPQCGLESVARCPRPVDWTISASDLLESRTDDSQLRRNVRGPSHRLDRSFHPLNGPTHRHLLYQAVPTSQHG